MNSGFIWCKGFFFMRLISSSLIATVNTFVTRVWVGGVAFLVVDSRRWCGPQMIGNLFSIQVVHCAARGKRGAPRIATHTTPCTVVSSILFLNRSSFLFVEFFVRRELSLSQGKLYSTHSTCLCHKLFHLSLLFTVSWHPLQFRQKRHRPKKKACCWLTWDLSNTTSNISLLIWHAERWKGVVWFFPGNALMISELQSEILYGTFWSIALYFEWITIIP